MIKSMVHCFHISDFPTNDKVNVYMVNILYIYFAFLVAGQNVYSLQNFRIKRSSTLFAIVFLMKN